MVIKMLLHIWDKIYNLAKNIKKVIADYPQYIPTFSSSVFKNVKTKLIFAAASEVSF